jgi:hypothetical protein
MMNRRKGRGAWGMYLVPYKRRLLRMELRLANNVDEAAVLQKLAQILAPTLN